MLGMEDRLVPANEASSKRYIYHSGKMHEVALNPLKFLKSGILPLTAKLRMGMEFFISPNQPDNDQSVYNFGKRRLGKKFAKYLLDPMVSGIFAGNIEELSLKAVFPNMHSMEQEYGGLFKALIAKKREAKKTGEKAGGPAGPGAVLHTFKDGMGELTDKLASLFVNEVKTLSPVQSLEYGDNSFTVQTQTENIKADYVVLACPSYEAAKIVNDIDKNVSLNLDAIPHAPVDVVCHGYSENDIEFDVNGFGVLIPRSEKIRSLGSLWSDSIFPGQAPTGNHLMRSILGGAHDYDIASVPDDKLEKIAHDDLSGILGIQNSPGFIKIFRHPKGIAQYIIGHNDKVAAIDKMESDLPGLFFTGASYRGVSVNGCIKDSFKVSENLGRLVRD
jgi:oxygen-dependent protoporphyrinogen oxidase